jgi:hypothetical protein
MRIIEVEAKDLQRGDEINEGFVVRTQSTSSYALFGASSWGDIPRFNILVRNRTQNLEWVSVTSPFTLIMAIRND